MMSLHVSITLQAAPLELAAQGPNKSSVFTKEPKSAGGVPLLQYRCSGEVILGRASKALRGEFAYGDIVSFRSCVRAGEAKLRRRARGDVVCVAIRALAQIVHVCFRKSSRSSLQGVGGTREAIH